MKKLLLMSFAFVVLISSVGFASASKQVTKKTIVEVEENQYSKSVSEEYDNKKVVTVESKIKNESEIKEFKKMQKSKIDVFVENKNLRSIEKDLLKNAVTTVTFTRAISLDELTAILKDSKSELIDCEVKYLNNENEWITACIKADVLSQDIINEIQKAAVESCKEISMSYEGITSARIKMNLYSKSYEVMSNNQSAVFLVDISDTLVRLDNVDFSGKLRVRVPDLSWSVNDIKSR